MNPLTYLVYNLYQFNYQKNDILKILLSLRRTNKELRDYVNNSLDRRHYKDQIYNILFRHRDDNSIIFNNFENYNSYLQKKNNKIYLNIFVENADSKIIDRAISINKFYVKKKNTKYIFNIFFINCKINKNFCYTSNNKYKYVNLYLINCIFSKTVNLICKSSYGSLNLIKCRYLPRLYIDEQENLYINNCIFNNNISFNFEFYKYIYDKLPTIQITRCKNIEIFNSRFISRSNTFIELFNKSNFENINIFNNKFYFNYDNLETEIILIKYRGDKILNNINKNFGYFIKYYHLSFSINNINLYKKIGKKNKIVSLNTLYNRNNILINFDDNYKLNVNQDFEHLNVVNLIYYYYKKQIQNDINNKIILEYKRRFNNYYESEQLSDFQLFKYLYIQNNI